MNIKDTPSGVEYLNDEGQAHREDGPAKIFENGLNEWWYNGIIHRIDGPARYNIDGFEMWFKHGSLHREDGPAIIYSRKSGMPTHKLQQYYIEGHEITDIVKKWLIENNIQFPFTEEQRILFVLTWGTYKK